MSDVSVSSGRFYTPKQVAEMLRVSEATVSRWAAQDATFPATRLPGRLVRIEEGALMRWIGRKTSRKALQVAAPMAKSPECGSGAGGGDARSAA